MIAVVKPESLLQRSANLKRLPKGLAGAQQSFSRQFVRNEAVD
jgi:hypothetical protein